jgi:hypothetical protein
LDESEGSVVVSSWRKRKKREDERERERDWGYKVSQHFSTRPAFQGRRRWRRCYASLKSSTSEVLAPVDSIGITRLRDFFTAAGGAFLVDQ